ncbi:MAG: UDP-N-acetylmuramoyl-L-alanine--D-glutamate ligase [Pseudomonadota bacterium]|nr:UDP-N-acetylmuramoyl-L-alanine--D-glutamate ligase [Pseudomonadota bacterium]
MRLADLASRRVAILGFGREGRATWQALRRYLPGCALTLFCSAGEREEALQLDDSALHIVADPATVSALTAFDVVIKSPGVSPYRTPIPEAVAAGVRFISGSTIWFAEHVDARTICITGTKGKSTTCALTAHLLRSIGVRTALCGNIGLPLLELMHPQPPPECWVIELSSFQTRDFSGVPTVAVVTNLIEEHLDWHGSVEHYIEDKLCILGNDPRTRRVLNARDAQTRQHIGAGDAQWFDHDDGWQVTAFDLCFRGRALIARSELALAGAHNAANACAALTAITAAGYDAMAALPALRTFVPLPHRLHSLGTSAGIEYVNDSIATTPQATIAALQHYAGRAVALILGGQDRGLDWTSLRVYLNLHPPCAVVCTGATAARVLPMLSKDFALRRRLHHAEKFDSAFAAARKALHGSGVLLLSPGAPSFGQFRDYVERGKMFARLAGFDPEAIAGIQGLGIA